MFFDKIDSAFQSGVFPSLPFKNHGVRLLLLNRRYALGRKTFPAFSRESNAALTIDQSSDFAGESRRVIQRLNSRLKSLMSDIYAETSSEANANRKSSAVDSVSVLSGFSEIGMPETMSARF